MKNIYTLLTAVISTIVIFTTISSAEITELGSIKINSVFKDVKIAGDYAYVAADYDGLRIFNISDPAHPTEAGHYDTPGNAGRIEIVDHYAYIADTQNGVLILDIADPANITLTAHYPTTGWAQDLQVVDNHLFVSDGTTFLVLDITDKANPDSIGSYGNNTKGFDIKGNLACIVTSLLGVVTLDMTDPVHPQQLGALSLQGQPSNVIIVGTTAYVSTRNVLVAVDISDPTKPLQIGSFRVEDSGATMISIVNDVGYWPMGDLGIGVLDTYNPAKLTLEWSGVLRADVGTVRSLALSGSLGYAVYGNGLLSVMDLSGYAEGFDHPIRFIDRLQITGDARGVASNGNYLYVASDRGFQVWDVSTPSSPMLVGNIASIKAGTVEISGNFAFTEEWGGKLHVINITDPLNPLEVGALAIDGDGYDIFMQGNLAYISNGASGLRIVDITDPAHPAETGFYYSEAFQIRQTAVRGDYAYCASFWAGLVVLDISKPALPDSVSAFAIGASVNSVALTGNYAITGHGSGLTVFDITDMAHPDSISTLTLPETGISTITVVGKYLICTDYSLGLWVVDFSVPTAPTVVATWGTPGPAFDVAINGAVAYIADDAYGIQIVDISRFTGGIVSVNDPIRLDAPKSFTLSPSYPNPFNSTVRIGFSLPNTATVNVSISDLTGRQVSTVADGRYTAGSHNVLWNAHGLAAGSYFVRMESAGIIQTQRINLIK